ncbi:hypothetical protein BDD30_2924 [Photorhabdus asymbiotica]|nr:hypothetical protein BDD30_2924 [Photorhabdus asymbiotica]
MLWGYVVINVNGQRLCINLCHYHLIKEDQLGCTSYFFVYDIGNHYHSY